MAAHTGKSEPQHTKLENSNNVQLPWPSSQMNVV